MTGQPHILIITHLPAEGEYEAEVEYEIVHPEDCPIEHWNEFDREFTYHTCDVSYEVDGIGLEGLGWSVDISGYVQQPEDVHGFEAWKGLPEGRYVIRAWHNYSPYLQEYDGGLELLGKEGDVIVA